MLIRNKGTIRWIGIVTLLLVIVLLAAFTSCGRHKSKTSVQPGINTAIPLAGIQTETTLAQALADLDAYPVPEGVNPSLFQELKDELARQLSEKMAGRIVSTPPTGDANVVDDLVLIDYGSEVYSLSWHYRNSGDYDQDGTVGISDITPIAMHYGEAVEEEYSLLDVIDGSGNEVIDIADITPIAMNYASEVAGYSIQGADNLEGPFPEISTVPFSAGTGEGCLSFTHGLSTLTNLLYRVVPFDTVPEEGVPSGVVSTSEMAFNPTSDVVLGGGTYNFSFINIPAGVTVTVEGDAVFNVSGDINIEGTVVSDGYGMDFQGHGDITITGTVDNSTPGDPEDAGDLIIHTDDGAIAIGTEDTPSTLDSSGNLDITNDPTIEEWEFDVLPDERSETQLPPVGSASADIIHDTVLPELPVEISFFGDGADPDGGPVTYEWSFGDGGSSTEKDPVHEYVSTGYYDVVLTITDDDAESCQSWIRVVIDDGDLDIPDEPAVWIEPSDLVVEADQEVFFSSEALDPQGLDLTYSWDFGDGGGSTESDPSHTYTAAGRYQVTLVVTDTDLNESTATASVYVFSPTTTSSLSASQIVQNPDGSYNINYNGGSAQPGRKGKRALLRSRGDTVINGGNIKAQDGGDGADRAGVNVRGGNGGKGGSLQILVAGKLTVRGGVTFASGDGGDGGSADADAPAGGNAYARGGRGGDAGYLLRIAATQGLEFTGAVTMNPGSGGAGGDATADGGDGTAQCPQGQDGGRASAYGGTGGKGSKSVAIRGNVIGLANVTVQGGKGGIGGWADATGGDGGDADCVTTATGGDGDRAYAKGGRGGNAYLSGQFGAFGAIAADAFKAGDGGNGEAWGGYGGSATANIPGPTNATGGNGAKATAIGGKGGSGRIAGDGGDADAYGGEGGPATAMPDHGAACQAGKSATAAGGNGGDAYSRYGKAGRGGGVDGQATSDAGSGGNAAATGGNGGDCNVCPGGAGGDGGAATATGGTGADATGNGSKTGGNGGNSTANAGDGGDGASCCVKFFEQQGGDGGDGGDASSTAGNAGSPGGSQGTNGGSAGDGGDGGDGWGPGSGGAKGIGTGDPADIDDGEDGVDGNPCPAWTIWYIYLSTIAPGPITPGTYHDLDVYLEDQTTKTGYTVEAYFLTEAEFGSPVDYSKEGDFLFISTGRVEFDLITLPGTFPVGRVDIEIDHSSMEEGAIQLIGYYEGGSSAVGNTAGSGVPIHETLELPPAPQDTPYFGFALEAYDFVGVECWWIEIIDP